MILGIRRFLSKVISFPGEATQASNFDFIDSPRIFSLAADDMDSAFDSIHFHHSVIFQDGNRDVETIGAFWDDAEKTRKRAVDFDSELIKPVILENGRLAYSCLWLKTIVDEFDKNGIPGLQEEFI